MLGARVGLNFYNETKPFFFQLPMIFSAVHLYKNQTKDMGYKMIKDMIWFSWKMWTSQFKWDFVNISFRLIPKFFFHFFVYEPYWCTGEWVFLDIYEEIIIKRNRNKSHSHIKYKRFKNQVLIATTSGSSTQSNEFESHVLSLTMKFNNYKHGLSEGIFFFF